MSEAQKFKYYYGVQLAQELATRIQAAYPAFDAQAFVAQVAARVDDLELKARVALIAAALHTHLPPDYPEALSILCATLGPELSSEQGMFQDGYHLMPIAHFVETYGLDFFEQSLAALHEITRRFSSEFAIRPFLVRYPQRTLDILQQWAHDPNPHVRRLVSEGTRPRLPWAARLQAFIADPTPVLHLLEALKSDPSPYVRKSVANNLNDILKDHPARVLALLRGWNTSASTETRWIIRHALRNLIKQGHPDALSLLALTTPRVRLEQLVLEPQTIQTGDTLHISLTLCSTASDEQNLVVDYLIHFVKANGTTRHRVFKLRNVSLQAGERLTLQKRHSFKPITTRRYYAGHHRLEIQVNGALLGGTDFILQP